MYDQEFILIYSNEYERQRESKINCDMYEYKINIANHINAYLIYEEYLSHIVCIIYGQWH